MKKTPIRKNKASARFPFITAFLPLALEFVDKAAISFGFEGPERTGLILAAEELYVYHAARTGGDVDMDLTLEDGGYRILLTLSFHMSNPDMRALNLAFQVDLDDETALDMLGPMIAARSVSGLSLDFGPAEHVIIRLWRERAYEFSPALPTQTLKRQGNLRITEPGPEDLRYFCGLVASGNQAFTPEFLLKGAMAADMLTAGDLCAALALDNETIVGGIAWRSLTESCVEMFGPYVFSEDPGNEILTELMDQAVSKISRTSVRGILRRQGPMTGYARFFDFLGEIPMTDDSGNPMALSYYYRQLKEETGGKAIYSEKEFAGFLHAEYDRLCLPRQIRETDFRTSGLREHSVIAVEFKSRRTLAILRPLCAGRDMTENMAAHIALLEHQGVSNILFEIDSARDEDMMFTKALDASSMTPGLIIPDAAEGDLVIFYLPAGRVPA
ncbi:MAG: hypothetical protein KKD44_22190 [Proteobacteria bacterium]|nr:hypothetical protein [Pseudomonadota bacterium]